MPVAVGNALPALAAAAMLRRLRVGDILGEPTGLFRFLVACLTPSAIERHGGRMWVDSTVGQGSRFHFTLRGAA